MGEVNTSLHRERADVGKTTNNSEYWNWYCLQQEKKFL